MMLLDYFGFLVGFLEKGTKSTNLGNFGVLRCNVGIPRSSVSPRQGVACPRRGAAEREAWTSLDKGLRRSVALFTDMCFCHVLLFRYSEDLSIGLMRTL